MDISTLLPDDDVSRVIKFVAAINSLKKEIRYSQVKNKKGDSVADHSRRLTMLAFLLAQDKNRGLDVNKVIKIALVHDLAEAMTGDIDVSLVYNGEITTQEKNQKEILQIKILLQTLPQDLADEIYSSREDYEFQKSNEASFVKALDKMEAIMHYIQEDFEGSFQPFIRQHGLKEVQSSGKLDDLYEKIKILIDKFMEKYE